MNQSGKTATLAMIAALIAAICAGCGMNRNYANNQIRQLPHSKVAIAYTVSEPAVTPAGAEASGDESSRPALHSEKKILSITYPHPNPKYARRYAEVTLREAPKKDEDTADKLAKQLVTNPFRQQDAASASDSSNDSKALRTVVNREDLEFLLRDLVADSFFDREQRQGGVDLSVTLGSRTTRKQWDHITSFDELASRVVTENEQRHKQQRGAVKPAAAKAELLPPSSEDLATEDAPATAPDKKSRNAAKF